MAGNYRTMTLEELEAECQRLSRVRQEVTEEARVVTQEIDRRLAEREALLVYERMSEPARAALAQMVNPQGVASQEAIGEPGSG